MVLHYNVTGYDNDPGSVSPRTETQNVTWCYTTTLQVVTMTLDVSPRGQRPRMLRYNVLHYNVTVYDNDPGRVFPSNRDPECYMVLHYNVTGYDNDPGSVSPRTRDPECYMVLHYDVTRCDNDPGRVSPGIETQNITLHGVSLQRYRL